jgi:8-oxo-dGTP diphosphatase
VILGGVVGKPGCVTFAVPFAMRKNCDPVSAAGAGAGCAMMPAMDDIADVGYEVPRIPASAGGLIFDRRGRLLILKPNYKKGWTIPGGQVDATGESPWEACRREVKEECGLEVVEGRLVCVDFLRPKRNRPGGMRFLFHCGVLSDRTLEGITLQAAELDEYRLLAPVDAAELLSGPVRRRVAVGVEAKSCVYLEEGRPVPGVNPAVPGVNPDQTVTAAS